MSFPWDSVRIVLNVKKTLPLLVVAVIIDILAYSLRPDAYLFWLGVLLILALSLLFFVQAYLVKVEQEMELRAKIKVEKMRRR